MCGAYACCGGHVRRVVHMPAAVVAGRRQCVDGAALQGSKLHGIVTKVATMVLAFSVRLRLAASALIC